MRTLKVRDENKQLSSFEERKRQKMLKVKEGKSVILIIGGSKKFLVRRGSKLDEVLFAAGKLSFLI